MIPPSDYCVLNEDPTARLSEIERLTLVGEAGLDRIVARFARQFGTLSLGGLAPNLQISDLLEALTQMRLSPSVATFERSTESPQARVTTIHGFKDGEVNDIAFTSQYPIPESHSVSREMISKNSTVHVRLWERRDISRPTLVAVHGWSMGDQKVNSLAFLPGLFYSLGYNVAIIELPFHGKRALNAAAPVVFPNLDVGFTSAVLAQIVSDLRATARLLESRGHTSIGVVGLSLGAYAASLWSSLDKLAFGVFIVPLASLGDLTWDLALDRFGKDELVRAGLSRQRTRALYFPQSPLSRTSATDESNLLVVAGRGDKIVPRHQVTLLKRRWPSAKFHWISGGHAAHFRKGRSLHIILEFLKQFDHGA